MVIPPFGTIFSASKSAIKTRGKGKGKFQPRTDHEGTDGEYRCSSTLPLTLALDGVGGQRHDPTVLPPGKTRCPLYKRLGGAPGPV